MGNANHTGSSSVIADHSKAKDWPITFHEVHSDNIQLSADRRRAKRIETFCKGICFSSHPILPNERIYIRFAEVSTSWSGAIRFGFMSHDPASLNRESLPRYACPDLTNSPGYWAKALPERLARHGSVLLFYVTLSGDVMFGINGEDKGVFFGGINTRVPLWALLDIYGNTVSVEFVDGYQMNNSSLQSSQPMRPHSAISLDNGTGMLDWFSTSMSFNVNPAPSFSNASSQPIVSPTFLPIRSISESLLQQFPFHTGLVGRNICLSSDGSVAVRRVEDYCNAYVFSHRPFQPGESLVVQVLSVDVAYTGGLAFGMTCCDPASLNQDVLPDDSDLLLDRPEYWIVNKDVCANPEVADELIFYLTSEGEVHYSRNGRYLSTLMHVDQTLSMWAFFDVYGSVQKIKMLGLVDGPPPWERQLQQPDLTVSLPVTVSQFSSGNVEMTPPPRPPPPRPSPSPTTSASFSSKVLPVLPPKQQRSSSMRVPVDSPPRDRSNLQLIQTPTHSIAATAFPSPPSQPVAVVAQYHHNPQLQLQQQHWNNLSSQSLPHPKLRPVLETVDNLSAVISPGTGYRTDKRASRTNVSTDRLEAADNASNECSVCLDKPSDCVLYTCGHMCMCYECAVNLQRTEDASCPICRKAIRDVIKIFRA